MQRIQISYRSLEREFERFKKLILRESGEEFVSFHSGLPSDWERYKVDVYNEGQRRLGVKDWNKENIGKGMIIRRVIDAIEISYSKPQLVNNLLRWDLRNGNKGRAHRSLYHAIEDKEKLLQYESALFDLYKGHTEREGLFNALIQHAGHRYPFIAYLFFLKDSEQFLPIAPGTFDKAFKMLDIPLITSWKCSYDNYITYLDVMNQIRQGLREMGYEDVSLIDSHSFCWMLVNLQEKVQLESEPESPPVIQFEPLLVDTKAKIDFSRDISSNEKEEEDADQNLTERDYDAQNKRNRVIGRQAEELVFQWEKTRLKACGREDLAESVKDVSRSPKLGYDIKSYNEDGSPRRIEVKAVQWSGNQVSFYVSSYEIRKSRDLSNYYFYLVSRMKESPVIHYLATKDLSETDLEPLQYRAEISVLKSFLSLPKGSEQ